jgi:hypothetical protein
MLVYQRVLNLLFRFGMSSQILFFHVCWIMLDELLGRALIDTEKHPILVV